MSLTLPYEFNKTRPHHQHFLKYVPTFFVMAILQNSSVQLQCKESIFVQ